MKKCFVVINLNLYSGDIKKFELFPFKTDERRFADDDEHFRMMLLRLVNVLFSKDIQTQWCIPQTEHNSKRKCSWHGCILQSWSPSCWMTELEPDWWSQQFFISDSTKLSSEKMEELQQKTHWDFSSRLMSFVFSFTCLFLFYLGKMVLYFIFSAHNATLQTR